MELNRLTQLANKISDGTIALEEYTELAEAIKADETGELAARLEEMLNQTGNTETKYNEEKWLAVADKILQVDKTLKDKKPVRVVPMFRRMVAAASITLLLGAGVYFLFFNRPATQATDPIAVVEKDVNAPTNLNAVLTLANGEKIILDSAGNGMLTVQGNTNVTLNNGQINYQEDHVVNNQGELLYNTLTVPRGSKIISVILSDGTKVWLNSESTLRYPIAFSGAVRRVELAGEGYFEVTKNAVRPFIVSTGKTDVKVLGTSFNINSYENEPDTKVTLVEGSVNLSKESVSKLLKPGEQAEISNDIRVHSAFNMDEVLAWKNGRFAFNGSDIRQVMRELARWYDLEVIYTKGITEKFHIEMTRNTNLSNVFKILEETGGVHFKIEGKKITVMP